MYFKFSKIGYKLGDGTLSFRFYDPDEVVEGKKMKEWLRFSVAFWHTINGSGEDVFGAPTFQRPWFGNDPLETAYAKVDALFEFCEKLGIEYFTFHDRDLIGEGRTIRESNKLLDRVVARIKDNMKGSKVKLLWGTANLFSHPRYSQGAATSPSPLILACAAAQVKKALEVTKELGGLGYVLWGGREGYDHLLLTDMELELNNLANFLRMVAEYKKEIGFEGVLMIEPKPKEPTKHQYDFDASAVLAFLRAYGLFDEFKLNIEANHATLAGHTFSHELRVARINGKLASIDANRGDLLLGWDTDQFPTDVYDAVFAMYEVLENGGLDCGLNFDAKVRRASTDLEDIAYGHVASMDTFALGLKLASRLRPLIKEVLTWRYADYESELGQKIRNGKTSLRELESTVLDVDLDDVRPRSLRFEFLEYLINSEIFRL